MADRSPAGARTPASSASSADAGRRDTSARPGIIGIGLAAVLTFALAQGSWEWFSAYTGVTLLVVILSFYRPTSRHATSPRSLSHAGNLTAYSLVVGLCAAIALAPALQRWSWLFPMPGTRDGCPRTGRYESLRTQAALGNLAGRDTAALAHTRLAQSHTAVADCPAATTTGWLPVYGAGAAVLTGLAVWLIDHVRAHGPAADGTAPSAPPG